MHEIPGGHDGERQQPLLVQACAVTDPAREAAGCRWSGCQRERMFGRLQTWRLRQDGDGAAATVVGSSLRGHGSSTRGSRLPLERLPA